MSIKELVIGGVVAFSLYQFIFGNVLPIPKTSIYYQVPQQQTQQKGSLAQQLSQMSDELGLDMTPGEWITNPNKAVEQATGQLNTVMNDLYKEAGLNITSTGDPNIDANAAMGASMQQINDILYAELEGVYNQK